MVMFPELARFCKKLVKAVDATEAPEFDLNLIIYRLEVESVVADDAGAGVEALAVCASTTSANVNRATIIA